MAKNIVKSEKEMAEYAAKVAKTLQGGEVLALVGDLGAGKTAFTKGLAKAFGIQDVVASPTFLLLKCYQADSRFRARVRAICHIDAYRIKKESELLNIGLSEHLADPRTVTVIEWADLVKGLIPPSAIWLEFAHSKNGNERIVSEIKRPN
jgi:tRNA threonylcarbamoyladenosine biosynthesis protein TsaE